MDYLALENINVETAQENAVVFSGQKILINPQTQGPFFTLKSLHQNFSLTFKNACINNKIILLQADKIDTAEFLDLLQPFKHFLSHVSSSTQEVILKGYQWLTWDLKTKFCGSCGIKTSRVPGHLHKHCEQCAEDFYPYYSPASMVLVSHQNKILLARSVYSQYNMYSALAGFIELGENAEQAARREVMEEVGLEITDLRYFGTQNWPFPNLFMTAFHARALSTELKINTKELAEARWFALDNLPELPPKASISRQLIESFKS